MWTPLELGRRAQRVNLREVLDKQPSIALLYLSYNAPGPSSHIDFVRLLSIPKCTHSSSFPRSIASPWLHSPLLVGVSPYIPSTTPFIEADY